MKLYSLNETIEFQVKTIHTYLLDLEMTNHAKKIVNARNFQELYLCSNKMQVSLEYLDKQLV